MGGESARASTNPKRLQIADIKSLLVQRIENNSIRQDKHMTLPACQITDLVSFPNNMLNDGHNRIYCCLCALPDLGVCPSRPPPHSPPKQNPQMPLIFVLRFSFGTLRHRHRLRLCHCLPLSIAFVSLLLKNIYAT